MLKNFILPVAYSGKQVQPKCGEIFYCDEQNLLLVCSLCEMKHFALEDFMCHIKNIHFDEAKATTPATTSLEWSDLRPGSTRQQQLSAKDYSHQPRGCSPLAVTTTTTTNIHQDLTKLNEPQHLEMAPTFKPDEHLTKSEDIDTEIPCDDDIDVDKDNNTLYKNDNQLRILQYKNSSASKKSSIWTSEEADLDWQSDSIQDDADADAVDDKGNDNENATKHSFDYDSVNAWNNNNRVLIKPRQPKEFKCRHCNKNYTTEKYLNVHIKLAHLRPKPFKCDNCELAFTSTRSLETHRGNAHTGFSCKLCDKIFKSRQQLYRHSGSHNGERKYICTFDNCGKAFRTQHCLTSHRRLHTRERNFVCEICGYRSFYKDGLIVHRRSHTGEKPFHCSLCERSFASKPLLVEHQAMHATDRPHKCEICDASFSRPKALYHHKHLHLAVKKFVCKICGNAYAQAAGLSAHMRNHKMSAASGAATLVELMKKQH